METVYQKILRESQGKEFKKIEDSRKWFRETALKVTTGQVTPSQIIKEKPSVSTLNRKSVWKLMLYNYSPKTKQKLPYYDTYPIVFPYKIEKDGFYGYNLHYLPPAIRAILMDNIYGLNSSSEWFKACTKKYLFAYIRSSIAIIPQSEWDLALFLPLQRFQKKADATVWADSINKIKGKR